MDYSEIESQEGIITQLRQQLKAISPKPRTINSQFNNRLCNGNVQKRMIVRRDKAKINSQIVSAQNRISLIQSTLGV